MKSAKTDFLYTRPSFVSGIARLFDFCGLYDSYNERDTDEDADAKAIFADWAVVGADMKTAIEKFTHTK